MIKYLFLILIYQVSSSISGDLIYQADKLFRNLNNNGTIKVVSHIGNDVKDLLNSLNSKKSRDITSDIFNNMNEFFNIINSNETREIIHNLRRLSKDSKVYIDLNDSNWKINRISIYCEIILILIIIIILLIMIFCIYKICKREKKESLDFYNPLLN